MIVVAAFEAPTVVAGLDDVTVMGQPVEQRGRHLGIAEHTRPFAERKIGGDDDGGALVEAADEMEQELAAGLCEGKIAQLVENDEVYAGQMFGEPALSSVAGLGLEPVDEIDDVVEATAGTIADTASRNSDGQMGLAGTSSADQDDIALLGDEAAAGEIVDKGLVDRRAVELEVGDVLGEGSLAIVSWYLIDLACFSLISAVSRSPTIRCGSCWRLMAVAMISSKAAFIP